MLPTSPFRAKVIAKRDSYHLATNVHSFHSFMIVTHILPLAKRMLGLATALSLSGSAREDKTCAIIYL